MNAEAASQAQVYCDYSYISCKIPLTYPAVHGFTSFVEVFLGRRGGGTGFGISGLFVLTTQPLFASHNNITVIANTANSSTNITLFSVNGSY
jgi:hypothetical protein